MKTVFIILIIFSVINVFAQPTLKWTSPIKGDSTEIGWFTIRNNPMDNRFYIYDQSSKGLQIMNSPFSMTPSYTIQFPIDWNLGALSVMNCDYTGDGLNDIIIGKWYGVGSGGRGAIRVVDISNGTNILELDNSSYTYSFQYGSDIDNDGKIEMIVKRTNQSNLEIDYLIYSTNGIPSSISNDINTLPNEFKLNQNYPNPFNPSTTIRYSLTSPEKVSIKIYDVSGQLVNEINKGHNQAGEFEVIWDGTNTHREKVSSGTYFYQIQAGEFAQAKKMILLK